MARDRSSGAASAATGDGEFIGPGTVLGRYRLVERIGEGGMGEVWRAHDDNLDRDVAIKMLLRGVLGDNTRRERFRREALVLSRLSHPGVATIFDFDARNGRDFLVMEYVAGGTLEARLAKGPLPLTIVMTLGAEIADALDNAHRHGFLHRDLKPGNVVLTVDDHAKILDFGLALLLSASSTTGRMTQPGLIVGSLPYMAPEQLFGEGGDARTDVYALGVMLYEMTTGGKPFVKDRPESLMFAIVNTAAPSARAIRSETPDALDRLIGECLKKDPSHRPASAAVVSQMLRGIRDGASNASLPMPARDVIRAIAVLPLRNVSNDPSQEYFADGLTESLISDLARVKTLRVISRTSVMTYKGVSKPIPEIARELNVDAVLEGSAHLVGKRVRMHVQLVSARTDDTLWAQRYDRELEDVLDLQSELAAAVTREVSVQLSPFEEADGEGRVAVNPEAHLEYLKSRHSFFGGSPQAIEVALRHARRALELDPGSALAWSALADSLIFRAVRGASASAVAAVEAMGAATKALEIDPSLAEAHFSIGLIKSVSGDVAGGMREFRKTVRLSPGMAAAHNMLGRSFYAYERHEQALESSTKSVSLDPLSSLMRGGLGDAYYFARDYEKSAFHYRMSLELDSRADAAHTGLARALEMLGRYDEARLEYDTGLRLSGVAGGSFGLAHVEAASGNHARAREMVAQLIQDRSAKVVSAWGIAVLYASLGDVDDTFHWLDIAVAEKAPGLMVLRAHPRLDPIRDDPRYALLVAKLGLDDATFENAK
ncbi:MAG: protein kinase [Gemmatimonadales bacterium]